MSDEIQSSTEQQLLHTLEHLLAIRAVEVKDALNQASQLVAEALHADKVDAFLLEPAIESLVAVGSSDSSMSRLQHRLGLATVALANGGYAVRVYQGAASFHTGHADQDPQVPLGVWQSLGARSILAVPLLVDDQRIGVLEVVSSQQDRFSTNDLHFAEAVARWVGIVAHRAQLAEHVAKEAAATGRRLAAEEMVTALVHDLRTPLTSARGYLELLQRRLQRESRQQDVDITRQIGLSLERLITMIAALLDAARLGQGQFDLAIQPVDMRHLLEKTVVALQIPETPITLQGLPEAIVRQADPDRLQQALENLIGNALKHSPPGIPVTVDIQQQTRDDGEWGVVRVHDEGAGIPAALQSTLFKRFARGANSTGLGLGLYLARGIAEAHGGTLTVKSRPGAGTTFTLSLPLNSQR